MRLVHVVPVLAMAALASGCQSTTAKGAGDVRLTIMKPADQSLRPGEINQVSIVVLREGFQSDVRIDFSGLPDGVRILETDRRFKEGDILLTCTLHASNEAPRVHNAVVTVTARGPGGLSASETFHVSVLATQAGMK